MRGAEREDVLFVLQVLGNKADAVLCECLHYFNPTSQFHNPGLFLSLISLGSGSER